MFEMFEGYGSELATLLWIVLIPAGLAIARWYATYVRDKALAKERDNETQKAVDALKAEIKKLSECAERFDKFIVAYEAYQKGRKDKTGSFPRPQNLGGDHERDPK